jgi:hypothetical protein
VPLWFRNTSTIGGLLDSVQYEFSMLATHIQRCRKKQIILR